MRVHDLISRIDAEDTKKRVKRAVDVGNLALRRLLTDDLLRFKLSFRGASEWGRREARAAIHTDDVGRPEVLDRQIPPERELAAIASLHLRGIHALSRGAQDVRALLHEEATYLSSVMDVEAARRVAVAAEDLAARLVTLATLDSFGLVEFLHRAVDDDILGCWEYKPYLDRASSPLFDNKGALAEDDAPPPEDHDGPSQATSFSGDIRIYWGIIGIVAKSLAVSIEGLTMVVLAHELAHAYTHLGFDRDGYRWQSEAFAFSDPALKEGLAQLYTQWLLEAFDDPRAADAGKAFELLMQGQPPVYRAHEPWLLMGVTPEVAATTLMAIRRRGPASHEDFTRELETTLRRTRGR